MTVYAKGKNSLFGLSRLVERNKPILWPLTSAAKEFNGD